MRWVEFPPRSIYIQRRSRAPPWRADRALPNDIRGVLHPPQFNSTGAAVATVDVPAKVCARGAVGERSQLGARDTRCPSRRTRVCLCFAHHEHRAFLVFIFIFHTQRLIHDTSYSDLWRRIITATCSRYARSSWVLPHVCLPSCGSGCGRPGDFAILTLFFLSKIIPHIFLFRSGFKICR